MTFEDKQELCEKISAYYDKDGNSAGGTLHIVLDDGNLETDSIQWCIDNSIKDQNDEEALVIARELLKLGYSARKRLYNNGWSTKKPEPKPVIISETEMALQLMARDKLIYGISVGEFFDDGTVRRIDPNSEEGQRIIKEKMQKDGK